MHFGCIDFPSKLVDSRAEGNLVVFAGAGVSIPPPSNLPDFQKLALELAQGTKVPEKGEPLDRFLGRLVDSGLRIHELTRDRLRRPDSKPNRLHFSLLKLFGGARTVRLVTTNFDNHFAAAAAEMWANESSEIFAAPALPVGADFLGLVHLHGSVMRDPKRMVLTDADFGKAYLTEGWARRFLQGMFSKYTVIFVGYSHNDPVMHYLARGLPSSTEDTRFALTLEGQDRFWKNLGIVPLTYPERLGSNSHGEQELALSQWVAFTAERPLDKRARIQEIVSKLPPGPGEDDDYLADATKKVPTVRFFTEFARTLEWFEWAQGRDTFLRLFREGSDSKDTDEILAWWFAETFAVEHAGKALGWIARDKLTLGPTCWLKVAFAIACRLNSEGGCPGLDRWVPLLIRTRPEHTNHELEHILFRCRYPEDATTALLLFQHLLRPTPELEPNDFIRAIDPTRAPDVDLELRTVGDDYEIREAWQRYFQPNLQDFAGALAAIAAAHLEETALLSKAYQSCDFDSKRFSDLTATGSDHSGLGVLVEVAWGTLGWLIQNAPTRGDGLIEGWWNARSMVLRRLALLGVAASNDWAADDKLGWLIERDLLYKDGFRREVAAVLEAAFRDSSAEMKDRVVDAALTVPTDCGEYREDLVRGMLWTLKTADPNCARVMEELSKIPQPAEYVPEAEPTPPSSGALLARGPADQVDDLMAYELKHAERRDRGGLTVAVQMAIVEKPDWGIELAIALRDRGVWDTVLWRSIAAGWNQDALSYGQWTTVLNLLFDSPQITTTALDEVVELLQRRTSGDSNPFKGPLLGLAVRVGLQIWAVLESGDHERKLDSKDWLRLAINDTGGRLAQFCLRMMWQAWKEAGDAWRGLTDDFRLYLESFIRGNSWAAEMARVVVAGNVQMLFALDAQWTEENVFGLFDWSADNRRAQQAWHGYLTWGKWNNDLLEKMLPHFRATFTRIEGMLGEHAGRFCELMAGVALYGAVHPIESGWLPEFTRTAGLKARKDWGSAVRQFLEALPVGKRREVWSRWMKSYWEFRLGAPPVLDPGEVVPMVEWSTELEDAFPEAVGLILRGPEAENRDMRRPCLRLQASGVWRTYPRESALLLRFLVQSESRLQFGDCIGDLVKELAPLGVETAVLVDVCHRLGELGDPKAEALKKYVESQGRTPAS